MHADPADALTRLAAWRARGADRLDPLRFHYLEALATRAQRHQGQARALLDERLARALAHYVQVAGPAERGDEPADAASLPPSAGAAMDAVKAGPLAGLVTGLQAQRGVPAAALPVLPVLADFRQLWSAMQDARRLKQSLDNAPQDAGPLNSSVLVHRAITLMQDCAPGYLQHFLAYADHLAWLERLHDARVVPAASPPAAGARKPRRRRG